MTAPGDRFHDRRFSLAADYHELAGWHLEPDQRWGDPPERKPEDPKKKWQGLAAMWSIFGFLEIGSFLYANGLEGPNIWALPFLGACLLFDLKLFIYNRIKRLEPVQQLAPLKKESLVRVWIEKDGLIRGADRGKLWMEENTIWFKGDRSWFRIPRQDLLPANPEMKGELDGMAPGVVLAFSKGGRPVRVGVQKPIQLTGVPSVIEPSTLEDRYRAFRSHGEPSEYALQFPPLGQDPTYQGSFFQRPISTVFNRVMTFPFFSTRWIMLLTFTLALYKNGLGNSGSAGLPNVPVTILIMLWATAISSYAPKLMVKSLAKPDRTKYSSATSVTSSPTPSQWTPVLSSELVAMSNQRARPVVSFAFIAAVSVIAILADRLGPNLLGPYLLTACAGCLSFALIVAAILRKDFTPRLNSPSSPSEDEELILCKMLVEVDGLITGGDVGRLRFVDDGIEFEGNRTRFFLPRQIIEKGKQKLFSSELGPVTGFIKIAIPSRDLRIGLKSIYDRNRPERNAFWLARTYFGFKNETQPSERLAELPPLEFDPAYATAPWTESPNFLEKFGPAAYPLVVALAMQLPSLGWTIFIISGSLGGTQSGWLSSAHWRGILRRYRIRREIAQD